MYIHQDYKANLQRIQEMGARDVMQKPLAPATKKGIAAKRASMQMKRELVELNKEWKL